MDHWHEFVSFYGISLSSNSGKSDLLNCHPHSKSSQSGHKQEQVLTTDLVFSVRPLTSYHVHHGTSPYPLQCAAPGYRLPGTRIVSTDDSSPIYVQLFFITGRTLSLRKSLMSFEYQHNVLLSGGTYMTYSLYLLGLQSCLAASARVSRLISSPSPKNSFLPAFSTSCRGRK